MDGMVHAPFTDEQVERLQAWQDAGYVHPFTCPNRGDGKHLIRGPSGEAYAGDRGTLVPTPDGWTCPDCGYTQDWAYDLMTRPLSGNPLEQP